MKLLPRRTGLFLFLIVLLGAYGTAYAASPQLPHQYIKTERDLAYERPADIVVNAGEDLQSALIAARSGQIIELEAGATFTGNFRLPNKVGTEWIYIRSSRYQELPAEGQRVGPEHSPLMPKIVSPNSDPAILTMFSAHRYRFVGIEISTAAASYNLVLLGWGLPDILAPMWMGERANSTGQLPYDITFDQCYIHSSSDMNRARTGILAEGKRIAVIDSHISNFKDRADAQAIVAWQGPGPYRITNNFLEATGENVMFGGGSGAGILTGNLMPEDIEIRGNYFFKRLAWYESNLWSVKNLLELKAAKRVLVSGNIFRNNWADAQTGSAILFTVRNQTGNAPWFTVRDIIFENNIVLATGQGVAILGEDNLHQSRQTKRILIRNNILKELTRTFYPHTRFFNITTPAGRRPVLDLTISHNLLLHERSEIGYQALRLEGDGSQPLVENFVFEDNILTHGDYGLNIFPDRALNYRFRSNAIVMSPGERSYDWFLVWPNFVSRYTTENFLVERLADIGFKGLRRGNYRLSQKSPYNNAASDGTDVGPDIKALNTAVYGRRPDSLAAPTRFVARSVSSSVVELGWQDNSNETAFRVSRKVGNSAWETWQEVAKNTTRGRFGGLAPGQTYSFVVHAKKGNSFSPSSNIATLSMPRKGSSGDSAEKLPPPAKLKALAVSPNKVRLRWKDKSDGETAFEVWMRVSNGQWGLLISKPPNSRRLKLSGTSPGTVYFFAVRAMKDDISSGWSNTASVTMPRN